MVASIEIGNIYSSNNYGDFKVLERLPNKKYIVQFIKSGFKTEVFGTNIIGGGIKDKTVFTFKYNIGDIIDAGDNEQAEILDISQKMYGNKSKKLRNVITIKFLSTGYVTQVLMENVGRRCFINRLKPSVFGSGILGYTEELEKNGRLRDMKEYHVWAGIIERACTQHTKNELSYNDVSVCERWKRFDYFLEDIDKIENYDKWKEFGNKYPNKKNEWELDKDTKIIGNKTYCLESCRFLHKKFNAGFTSWCKSNTKQNILNDIKNYDQLNKNDEVDVDERN